MHPLHLHSHSSTYCKQLTSLLSKKLKLNFRAFCSVNVTRKSDSANGEKLKAAFLHPKNTNLTVETLVPPKKISDGEVNGYAFTL